MLQTLYNVPEYNEELIDLAIAKMMEALSIEKDLHPDCKVVIKPNLVMAKSPSFPATTHPLVIKSVAKWLAAHGIKDITLAESSGGLYNGEYMKNVYRVCGMQQLAPLVKLNMDFSAKTVNCPAGFQNHSFHIITPICEADYIINICKLKTHAMTGYSGGIKNLFGVIPGLEKPQMHYRFPNLEDFSRMLVELAETVKPDVTIIDAIDAMEGNGPTGGNSHPLYLLLGSKDVYTQDYFAAGLMGLDPKEIMMLKLAVEQGLALPDDISLSGDAIPENLTPFQVPDTKKLDFTGSLPRFLQKPFAKLAGRLLKSYPQLRKELCVGCGKCAESCPAHIIDIRDKKAHFKRKGCISCFCCQEMCPMKAIFVKKAL